MTENNMRNNTALLQLPLPNADSNEWPMRTQAEIIVPKLFGNQSWPKISIVTPSYNQGSYLEKTIRSVLLQGYPNLEYIIIDGGSTDQSVDIIRKYEPWIDFWVSEKDRGQSHAINKGFDIATGDLLGWLNSDDYYLPGTLFKIAQTYLENRSAGAIYGHGHIVDLTGQVVHKARTFEVNIDNLFEWFAGGAEFMQPSCLFTSQAWLRCGPLAEDLQYAMDLDLWIKIAGNYKFQKVDELLSISLRHDDAKTYAYAEHSYLDVAMVYIRHGREDKARIVLENQIERFQNYQRECENFRKIPLLGNIARIINKHMS